MERSLCGSYAGLEKAVTARTGLEELDAISESLLKQSLPQVAPQPPM